MTNRRLGLGIAAALLVVAAAAGYFFTSGSSHPAAAPIRPAQIDAARTGILMVLDDYERDGAAAKTGKAKKNYGADFRQYYADATAMAKFHGNGGIGAPLGCGAAAGKNVIDGAIIGTATAAAGTITIPVSLYVGPTPAARLTVAANSAGKLTGFACHRAANPNLPGATTLSGFYGGVAALATDPNSDQKAAALKDQFLAPAFAKFTRTDVQADQATCAEDTMTYWHAVYDPAATTTGAQWYFNSGGGPGRVNMSVHVDPAASRVAWVYCFGQLTPVMSPGAYSDSQVQSYVGDLFNDYAYLQALKPFGADTSGMKAYFASAAAYQTAVNSTGTQPLECSRTPATSISADNVTVTGTTAVVDLTSSPSGHPVTTGALGHPKVTVDMTTMKFTTVTCS